MLGQVPVRVGGTAGLVPLFWIRANGNLSLDLDQVEQQRGRPELLEPPRDL